MISSGAPSFRAYPQGFIFDHAAGAASVKSERTCNNLLSFTNSKLALEQLLAVAPTLNYNVGQIANLPYCEDTSGGNNQNVSTLVRVAHTDWDGFETSWGFSSNPLVSSARQMHID